MAEILAPAAEMFDKDGTIITDVMCRRCGYNLRGLPGAGHCPECGTPVGRSTLGDLLQFSDPAWLAGMARGASLILWGMVAAILGSFAGGLLVAFGAPPATSPLLNLIGYLMMWYGTWLLTEPDPSRIGEDVYGRARRIVRITLLIGVLSQGLSFVQQAVALSAPLLVLLAIAVMAAGLVGLVGWFYQFVYLEKLAERIPDRSLAGRARGLRWTLVILLGLGILLGGGAALLFGTMAAPPPAPGAPGPATGPGAAPAGFAGAGAGLACAGGLIMLASLIALLFYVRMIWRFKNAFREKAAQARDIWQNPAGQRSAAAERGG